MKAFPDYTEFHSPFQSYYIHCEVSRESEYYWLMIPGVRYGKPDLFHCGIPIGTAAGNFVAMSEDDLLDFITRVDTVVSSTSSKEDKTAELKGIQEEMWRLSPLLSVLISEIQLLIDQGVDEVWDKEKKHELIEMHIELKNSMNRVYYECFEVDRSENMMVRYVTWMMKRGDGNILSTLSFKHAGVSTSFCFIDEPEQGSYEEGKDYHVVKLDLHDDPNDDRLSVKSIRINEFIDTDELLELFNFLLYKYIKLNVRVRKCKSCGRYFGITDNYRSEYCDRLIEGSKKTCKEMGYAKQYEKRIMDNPAVREYKRSYKAHNARVRYGSMTKAEFSEWSKAARAMRDRCLAGEISLDELIAWLDSDKLR